MPTKHAAHTAPFPNSEAAARCEGYIMACLRGLPQNLLLLLATPAFYYLTSINATDERELTSLQVCLRGACEVSCFGNVLGELRALL